MNSKYEIIKELHRNAHAFGKPDLLKDVPYLIESWVGKNRVDDGVMCQVNISNPVDGVLVVGLRYTKRDGTITEDIFEFSALNPNKIEKFYKGKYEREINKEYKGTHKLQNVSSSPYTSANSCSLYIGNEDTLGK